MDEITYWILEIGRMEDELVLATSAKDIQRIKDQIAIMQKTVDKLKGKQKKKPGRPSKNPLPTETHGIRLDDWTVEAAKRIGEGQLSIGVVRAVKKACEAWEAEGYPVMDGDKTNE